MISRTVIIMLALFLSIIIIIPDSYALGISPSRLILYFEPDLEKTVEFYVTNSGDKEISIELYKKGDLAEYVVLSETSSTIPAKGTKTFTYNIKLPYSLDGAGIFDTRIGAIEAAPEDTMVGGRAAVESQLWVKKLFDGKYAEVELTLSNVYVGETMQFLVKITNLGTEFIDCNGVLEIFDSNNKKVTEIKFYNIMVNSDSSESLFVEWKTQGAEVGSYKAVVKVFYSDKEASDEKEFKLISKNGETNDVINNGTGYIGDRNITNITDRGDNKDEVKPQASSGGLSMSQLLLLIFFIIIGLLAVVLYFKKLRDR